MSIENAKAYLLSKGFDTSRIIEFDTSSATVELAAEALGCQPAHIAKSITFNVNGKAVMIVTAGDTKIDNARFKAKFGVKAKMLTPEEALEMVGHAVGGVCPFGIKEGVEVYLDNSMKRFEYVYPACGSSNSCVKLTLTELEELSCCKEWADICKLRQEIMPE